MEIREFAERVLFDPSLDEKLAMVGKLTDDAPGQPVAVPSEPARDASYRLRTSDSGAQPRFPGRKELEQELGRGQALHFFANHEIMALELMALALLRFVDAPKSWRASVVETMRDEQHHARLYLQRMASCGVAMGDIRANDHFWRIGAGMDSPLTYSAVVGLTLEQANLDFAAWYQEIFLQIGDTDTAMVLQRVLDDEVHHVNTGLKWLQRLKQPEQSTWQAWTSALPHGLTPAHAKGRIFVTAPRRKAGLDGDFIERLRVYNRSRARPPTVRWFDADDAELNNLLPAGSESEADDLRADLSLLPLPLCRQGDVLVVERAPRLGWLTAMQESGFQAPELMLAPTGEQETTGDDDRPALTEPAGVASSGYFTNLAGRRLGRPAPWRWTRRTRRLADVMAGLEDANQPPGTLAADALAALTDQMRALHNLPPMPADGRPQLRLAWLLRVDSARSWSHLGLHRLLTDPQGRHRGSVLGRQDTGLHSDMLRFLHGRGRGWRGVERRLKSLGAEVAERLAKAGVLGEAALQAVVYTDSTSGDLKLDAFSAVETTTSLMHVGREVDKRVARASRGVWWLANRADLRRSDAADFAVLVQRLATLLPERRDAGDKAPLRQGVLATGDPQEARCCVGLAVIATSAESLRAALIAAGLGDPFAGWE